MDSDFAKDQKTRRSTRGFVFKFGGGAISWLSKKQQIVTISTIESKYCALKETGQQAAWIRQVLLQLGYISQDAKSVKLNYNNISALSLAENNQTTDRSKYIDVYYH
jgi:isoleucyl-tRNA synthetase